MKIARTRSKERAHVNVIIEGIENQEEADEITKEIKEVLQRKKHQSKISYCIINMGYRE